MFIHACTLCNLYVCSQNTVYVQSYLRMHIYILCTIYVPIPNLNVYMLHIHVYLYTDVEEVNIVWYFGHSTYAGSFPSASDRCPATSAPPWGRRVATWWTKKCSKWKVDASRLKKNRSFVTSPHKDEYFSIATCNGRIVCQCWISGWGWFTIQEILKF